MVDLIVALIVALASVGGFLAGVFCTLKAVQLGLKWKQQAEVGALPTTDTQDKEPKESPLGLSSETVANWLYGKSPVKDEDDG